MSCIFCNLLWLFDGRNDQIIDLFGWLRSGHVSKKPQLAPISSTTCKVNGAPKELLPEVEVFITLSEAIEVCVKYLD